MFTITLAEKLFCIENKYPYTEKLCSKYIVNEHCENIISVSDDEILYENKDGRNWSADYLESLAIYRKICESLIDDDTILFHCSALEIGGTAYIFTAPSGTGKSTHTRLWREYFGNRVTMINDDKPLIKIADTVTVYGTPYGGKENIHNNISAKVGGIVVLYQSPENTIKRIGEYEAYPVLLNQTYRPDDISKTFKIMDLVKKLSALPVYKMGCNISENAVITAYKTLTGGIENET